MCTQCHASIYVPMKYSICSDCITYVQQSLLYTTSSSTVTVWWTDAGDQESHVRNFGVRLRKATDSCIVNNTASMETIVDWTMLPANSTSYEFAYLSLQVRSFTVLSTYVNSNTTQLNQPS